MANRDYSEIMSDYLQALADKDIDLIIKYQEEKITSTWTSKGDWFRLSYFYGKVQAINRYNSFFLINKSKLLIDFKNGFWGVSEDIKDIDLFFKAGTSFPFWDEKTISFIESYYMQSGTFQMIKQMLYDEELLLLQRPLRHYDEDLLNKKHSTFTTQLLEDVFNAGLSNEDEYDIDELIEDRCNYKKTSYEPVYVYNRETNRVERSTSRIVDERTKFIIGLSISSIFKIKEICKDIFGSIDVLMSVLLDMDMADDTYGYDIDCTFDMYCLKEIISKLSLSYYLPESDSRIISFRNKAIEGWLKDLNEKDLH